MSATEAVNPFAPLITAPAKAESKPETGPLKSISLVLKDIIQEYPAENGKVNRVIDGVNLSFDKPSVNMLLGPSGCGKSTLLRMMGGVRPPHTKTPTSGSIVINSKLCEDAHEDAIMVFQRYSNRPDLTVRENVEFPFTLKLWRKTYSKKQAAERVQQLIHDVGLEGKENLYPSQLSGGQNQRVALARALSLEPRILLMDEPFGALDAQTRQEMQFMLLKLHKSNPCLVVFVTHDVSEALLIGDRAIVLSTSPAKVVEDFTIPGSQRTQAWLRSPEALTLDERIRRRLVK